MKIFDPRKYNVSRKYILAASAYKRLAQKSGITGLSFSAESLLQQYEYETFGVKFYHSKYGDYAPDSKCNGYTHGKHLYDINLSAITEDIAKGYFAKIEFLQNYSIPVMMRRQIAALPCAELFGWRNK